MLYRLYNILHIYITSNKYLVLAGLQMKSAC